MKKLLLLAAVAAGVAVVVKSKSEQLKAGAARVTSDPRVQSALATASEKAAPVTSTVKEKAAPYVAGVTEKAGPVVSAVSDKVSTATAAASSFAADKLHKDGSVVDEPVPGVETVETDNLQDVPPTAVDEVVSDDPVSAPEFTGFEPPKVEDTTYEPEKPTEE